MLNQFYLFVCEEVNYCMKKRRFLYTELTSFPGTHMNAEDVLEVFLLMLNSLGNTYVLRVQSLAKTCR